MGSKNYLDAVTLQKMFIEASKFLLRYRENPNRINLFPVPDGDTGTNMSLLLKDLPGVLTSCSTIEEIIDTIRLHTAGRIHGYSGTYLFLFVKGFCNQVEQYLKRCPKLDSSGFVNAILAGAEQAVRESSVKPKEGTILTVMKKVSQTAADVGRQTADLCEILKEVYLTAEKSLEETKKELRWLDPATKMEVGLQNYDVPDAGALGFYYFLGGFMAALGETPDGKYYGRLNRIHFQAMGNYGYHTEFYLSPKEEEKNFTLDNGPLSLEELKRAIVEFAGEGCGVELLKLDNGQLYVHVHVATTNEISQIEAALLEVGEIRHRQVDDMSKQYRETFLSD